MSFAHERVNKTSHPNTNTNKSYKIDKMRGRSQSTCQLLCFHCDQQPSKQIQQNQVPNLKINKLSLKKHMQEDDHNHVFRRSTSDRNLNLNKFRSETSRSQNQIKELMLFKKKAKIQHQIQKVDQQMSRLTLKYQKNIHQLRNIKRQLQILRNS